MYDHHATDGAERVKQNLLSIFCSRLIVVACGVVVQVAAWPMCTYGVFSRSDAAAVSKLDGPLDQTPAHDRFTGRPAGTDVN
jgi:hypothetical protein